MIIGLAGKRLSGKDTVANYLVEKHGFEHLFFSKVMKEAVAALFDITVEEVDEFKSDRGGSLDYVTVRLDVGGTFTKEFGWVEFLQRFGTDMGRKVLGEDIWVNYVFVDPVEYYHATQVYEDRKCIIKDVRFENEAQRILDLGGKIIQIIRPNIIDEKNDNHKSEFGLSEEMIEYVIVNDSTIESLYKDVDAVLENIHANS